MPAEETSPAKFGINHLISTDFYRIAKLNSEAKHRALPDFNIVDLRGYGYFSRFIDLYARFLIAEVVSCIVEKKELVPGPENIVRDYRHPQDIMSIK